MKDEPTGKIAGRIKQRNVILVCFGLCVVMTTHLYAQEDTPAVMDKGLIETGRIAGIQEKKEEEEEPERRQLPSVDTPLSDWIIGAGMAQEGETAKDILKDIISESQFYYPGRDMRTQQLFEMEARRRAVKSSGVFEVEKKSIVENFLEDFSGFAAYTPKYDNNFFHVQNDTESFLQETLLGLRYQRVGVVGLDITSSLSYQTIDLKGLEKHPTPSKSRSGGVKLSYQPAGWLSLSLTTIYNDTNDVLGEADDRVRSISDASWTASNNFKARVFLTHRDILELNGSYTHTKGREKNATTRIVTIRRQDAVSSRISYTHVYSKRLLLRTFLNSNESSSSSPGSRLTNTVTSTGLGATVVITPQLSLDLDLTQDALGIQEAVSGDQIDNNATEGAADGTFGITGSVNYQFTGIPRTSMSATFKEAEFQQRTSIRQDITKANATYRTELLTIALQHQLATPKMALNGSVSKSSTITAGDATTLTTYTVGFSHPILEKAATINVSYQRKMDRVTSAGKTEETDKSSEYDEHIFFIKTTISFGVPKR